MTSEALLEILNRIQRTKCETNTLELKSACFGCPKKLYDTFSSFSNQDEGGIIIFGVEEDDNFRQTGVYDPQDLQKKIGEQALQMEPVVRPLMTVAEKDGKFFVSAEIPAMDLGERPCHYRGHGRLKGSYIRIGDRDEQMTEYEIYSYDAFLKKYQDDVRVVPRATLSSLDQAAVNLYVDRLRHGKPNLSRLGDKEIYELMSITRDGNVTLNAALLFSPYPQAYFPQLSITAIVVPGREIGDLGAQGERFMDNKRIEGPIVDMLEAALSFVGKNMRTKTIIDPHTSRREDKTDYPMTAVREAILNALVHRDYSIHTEGMPIQLIMYEDRMEIRNPGGIYGRMKIDQLGKVQPDTRNPVLAGALEVMGLTENRYSGIPTIRKAMAERGLPAPVFADERGAFVVKFYKEGEEPKEDRKIPAGESPMMERTGGDLIDFCQTPRTREEICDFLDLKSKAYAINTYVTPLVREGQMKLLFPDTPRSRSQRYVSVGEETGE